MRPLCRHTTTKNAFQQSIAKNFPSEMELNIGLLQSLYNNNEKKVRKKNITQKCPYLDFLVLSFAETEIQLGNRKICNFYF